MFSVGCVHDISSSFLGVLVAIPTYQGIASAWAPVSIGRIYSKAAE